MIQRRPEVRYGSHRPEILRCRRLRSKPGAYEAALERQLAEQNCVSPRKKDWRRSVGKFDDGPDFYCEVLAEGQAIREATHDDAG